MHQIYIKYTSNIHDLMLKLDLILYIFKMYNTHIWNIWMYNVYLSIRQQIYIKYTWCHVMLKLEFILICVCIHHCTLHSPSFRQHCHQDKAHLWICPLTCKRLFDRSKLSCSSLATCLGKQDGLNLTWMSLLSFGTSKSDKKFNRTLNPTYVSCLCLKLHQISSAVVIG